jgi:hypothetical protein
MRAPRPSANEQEAGRPLGRWHRSDRDYFMEYHVTGVTVRGARFKRVYERWIWANGINLYKGSVWGVREDGTRKLLKRVYN